LRHVNKHAELKGNDICKQVQRTIDNQTALVYSIAVTKKEISEAASTMGRRGYQKKLEKVGLEKIQETARENGKLGGRPKGGKREKSVAKKGTAR